MFWGSFRFSGAGSLMPIENMMNSDTFSLYVRIS